MASIYSNGDFLPSTSRMWPDQHKGPWLLVLRWQAIAGRAECVGVEVTSAMPEPEQKARLGEDLPLAAVGVPVQTSVIRSVAFAEVIAEERERVQRVAEIGSRRPPALPRPPTGGARGGMRPATWRRLERVAAAYREAWRRGEHPTQAVAAAMGITDPAAASLVARARQVELLPPTLPGAPRG